MTLEKIFKNNQPIIRDFQFPVDGDAGDMPHLWNAYRQGRLLGLEDDLEISEFLEFSIGAAGECYQIMTVEDLVNGKYEPVAIVFIKSMDHDHWQIEPHVIYYDNATTRIKFRTYLAFLKKVKYRRDVGACVVRVPKHTTKLANKAEKMGLIEYVGKIWGGRPGDNDYLYSVRCNRKV